MFSDLRLFSRQDAFLDGSFIALNELSFRFGTPGNGTTSIFQAQAGQNSTSTLVTEALQAIQFSAARGVRQTTIILSTFNTIAAFATASWILHESQKLRKDLPLSRRLRKEFLSFVSSPDLFPLILSGAIFIQSIIFAVSQSSGLDGFTGPGCVLIAHFMLPGLMLVPTTQFVFGCELALRAVQAPTLKERGKWMIPLCLTAIGTITLIFFLVADLVRAEDECFLSLLWFVVDYAQGIFVVLALYSSTLIAVCIYVYLRLTRTYDIEEVERVGASRMIFFLACAVISNGFLMPFFFVMGFLKTDSGENYNAALNLAIIGSIVAAVTGIVTGGLHIFLRSSSISAIRPFEDPCIEKGRMSLKGKIRVGAFSDTASTSDGSSFVDSAKEKEAEMEVASPSTIPPPAYSSTMVDIKAPRPAQVPDTRDKSLPGQDRKKGSVALLPSTAYNPNLLTVPGNPKRPPSAFSMLGRHRRNSSTTSRTTVQIGLRLSNIKALLTDEPKAVQEGGKAGDRGSPKADPARQAELAPKGSNINENPSRSSNNMEIDIGLRLSNLSPTDVDPKAARFKGSPIPVPLSNFNPAVKNEHEPRTEATAAAKSPASQQQLPLVRTAAAANFAAAEQARGTDDTESLTLSPAVYSAKPPSPSSSSGKIKVPSPKGVGFAPAKHTAQDARRENGSGSTKKLVSLPSSPIDGRRTRRG